MGGGAAQCCGPQRTCCDRLIFRRNVVEDRLVEVVPLLVAEQPADGGPHKDGGEVFRVNHHDQVVRVLRKRLELAVHPLLVNLLAEAGGLKDDGEVVRNVLEELFELGTKDGVCGAEQQVLVVAGDVGCDDRLGQLNHVQRLGKVSPGPGAKVSGLRR